MLLKAQIHEKVTGQLGTRTIRHHIVKRTILAPQTIWHHGQFGTAENFLDISKLNFTTPRKKVIFCGPWQAQGKVSVHFLFYYHKNPYLGLLAAGICNPTRTQQIRLLVPNCPLFHCGAKSSAVPYYPLLHYGAKLSWCRVKLSTGLNFPRCQIVRIYNMVPNCLPAWAVPNCPGAKLSWCQIVMVPNCPRNYVAKMHRRTGFDKLARLSVISRIG